MDLATEPFNHKNAGVREVLGKRKISKISDHGR